jgi:hypothetical protein
VAHEIESSVLRARYGLLLTALAPLIPQILGSAFNIWYNATVIEPMFTPALRQRFFATVMVYNAVVYPIGVYLWRETNLFVSGSVSSASDESRRSTTASGGTHAGARRLIHLPWFAAAICGAPGSCAYRFYRRAASSAKSVGSALALASADFVLCLGFHRGHAFILPGRARQPVGIVSGFLS